MAVLHSLLWVSTLLLHSQLVKCYLVKQTTCGSATPSNLTAGMGQVILTPNFPGMYSASSTCSWNYVTAPGGTITVSCAINLPCTDSFTIGTGGTTGTTHCGAKAIQAVFTGSASINLRPISTSLGGYAICLVTAAAPPATTKPPLATTRPPLATTRPPLATTRPPLATTRPPLATTRPPLGTTKPPLVTTRPPLASTQPPAATSKPPSVSTPAPAPVTTKVPSTTCNCGIRGPNRIVGGSPAGANEYPWMVMLLRNMMGPFCGGSIIAPGWVLTAAHCTDGISLSTTNLSTLAGRNDVMTQVATQQLARVAQIIQHPSYDSSTMDNDLSLLKLASPFTMTTAVSPICLPIPFQTMSFANQTGIGTGWGTTSSGGSSSNILLEVSLPILSSSQCNVYSAVAGAITTNMICTYEPGKDTCQGDSGGPLNWVDPVSQRVFLAGVTSWGVGCADVDAPGVYAKVNNYLTWIQQTTGVTFCSP